MELEGRNIKSIREGLLNKEFTCEELTRSQLKVIEDREPEIHAYLHVAGEPALEQARAVDRQIQKGLPLGRLAGIPASLKDGILAAGLPCTAASKILENYEAPYDAAVTRKLKEAGAVILGKTNMDEFGMGASTENSAFGETRNPHDPSRVPGGSSGGAAASVAAGEAVFALGEDTGGSIRQPSSFCGVVGLKPTYGAVSRHGVISLASSLDQVGPIARTVEDAQEVFQVIAGRDPKDATSVDYSYEVRDTEYEMRGLRVGVPKEYFAKGLDGEIRQAVERALSLLEEQGVELREITLPHTEYALAAYYVINTSEASSNLARYDGIRYGRGAQGKNLMDEYLKSRGEGFGPEVKRRIMLGTFALSAGYYDAYYLRALKVRRLLQQDFTNAFEQVDIIAGPVSPVLPFKRGERVKDPLAMYLVDVYTVPVNMAGLPAISLPIGSSKEGLPIGLHLIAPAFQDSLLFQIGKTAEQMNLWKS